MQDGKYVILCIDDDPDILMVLRTMLEASDYVMLEAGSAEEGLKVYKEQKPDLVIVDLMMEEIDAGTSFVTKIKAMGETPPIYMLSSVGDDLNLQADFRQMGISGVLQKPLQKDRLLSLLSSKLKK